MRLLRLLACLASWLPLLAGAADSYQYDELGNLQTLTTGTGTHTYSYDEVNRLDQESGPAGARDHAYDLNGNRTSDGAGTSATYTASTDRLVTINGTAVTLDAAGNLTGDGTTTYTRDAAGRLKTVSRTNKLWATYYYDYKSSICASPDSTTTRSRGSTITGTGITARSSGGISAQIRSDLLAGRTCTPMWVATRSGMSIRLARMPQSV